MFHCSYSSLRCTTTRLDSLFSHVRFYQAGRPVIINNLKSITRWTRPFLSRLLQNYDACSVMCETRMNIHDVCLTHVVMIFRCCSLDVYSIYYVFYMLLHIYCYSIKLSIKLFIIYVSIKLYILFIYTI